VDKINIGMVPECDTVVVSSRTGQYVLVPGWKALVFGILGACRGSNRRIFIPWESVLDVQFLPEEQG
jgi:hypothetical protein